VKKKILLINPAFQQGIRAIAQTTVGPPLGLSYIAAVLENQGHDVRILDANALNFGIEEILKSAADYKPDFAGFTEVTPTVDLVHKTARSVKEMLPDVKILAGGPHVTFAPDETLDHYSDFDYLFRGEAEATVAEFLKSGQDENILRNLKGIAYKNKDGEKIINSTADLNNDLDSIPFPSRHLLPMHRYRSPDSHKITTISAMRGCPARCIYCNVPRMSGRSVRFRSPARVVEEMLFCQNTFGTEFYYFIDDTFTTDRNWVLNFCDAVLKASFRKKVSYVCLTRPDCIDREILINMKKSGLARIELGIESGSEKSLRFLGKGIEKEQILEAFKLAKDLSISTMGFLMLNIPVEGKDQLKETESVLKKADPDFIQISFLTPYPGTPYYKYCMKKDIITSKNYSEYSFLNNVVASNPFLSQKEIRRFFIKLNLSFYLHPKRAFRLLMMVLKHGSNPGSVARASLSGLKYLLRKIK
jgi:radical SAM superfamily enzyme YgiQ (UPF0313 family)